MAEIVLPEHISVSQVRTWLDCQRRWYFRYVCGLKIPPPGAVVVGSAVHQALRHTNVTLRDTERLPPLEEVMDVYAQAFEAEAPDALWRDEDPAKAKDGGYAGVRAYYERHAQDYRPVDVEHEVRVPLRGVGVDLVGVVDLRTPERIVDYKTTGRKPSEVPPEVAAQIWLYQYGYRELGVEISGGEAVYIVTNTKSADVVKLPIPSPTPSDVARWMRVLADARKAMELAVEHELFLPAPPGAWYCSPEACGFWDVCHREF